MRKSIIILLVNIVILGFNFTVSLSQTTVQGQTQSAVEQEASKLYSDLSLLSVSERKQLYIDLTPELKSELWKVQLRLYLLKNSDLTNQQKKAIEEAIIFIKPQFYKIAPDSTDWEEKVNKPVQLLEKRILEVFPREAVREFLTNLGGSKSQASLNPSPLAAPENCDCSSRSDWCGEGTSCENTSECRITQFCGTLGLYICNGVCVGYW